MNEREKKLLTLLGKHPTMSAEELRIQSDYKWKSTISKKITYFKRHFIVYGPVYFTDYGRLCKNRLNQMYCFIETQEPYDRVVSYLQLIKPLKWVYPIQSPRRTVLDVSLTSSDDSRTKALLQLLKDNYIIQDYTIYSYHCRKITQNPNFSGIFIPRLNNLLEPCEVPDMSLGEHDTRWNECDMRVLPYLETGYKTCRLIEIMKAERNSGYNWTYEQLRYSLRKMIENRLIQKTYIIYPIRAKYCTIFLLYLKAKSPAQIQRILYNFGRESRIYKHYVSSENWGILCCASHPLFYPNLIQRLDIDEIVEKDLYHLDPVVGLSPLDLPTELECFDIEKQTLEYPYHVYEREIREKLEDNCT